MKPGGGGDHQGRTEEGEPGPVPAVHRIQVGRTAAQPPGGEPDGVRDQHPGGGKSTGDPLEQDQEPVAGRLRPL